MVQPLRRIFPTTTSRLLALGDRIRNLAVERNYHLYYRLRQSYGDFRLLHEAPGHYCLAYEQTEVISFVQLSLLFGWDVHLIPTVGYGQAFISHDEWINLGFDSQHQFEKTCKALEHSKVKFTIL